MQIRYTNTHWDIIYCNIRLLAYNIPLMGFVIIFPALIYAGTYSPLPKDTFLYSVCLLIIYYLFFFSVWLSLMLVVQTLTVLLASNKGVVGEHILTISEEGIEETTEYNRNLVYWKSIRRIQKVSTYYAIFITDYQAHVIPTNRPILEGDLKLFIQKANSFYKSDLNK